MGMAGETTTRNLRDGTMEVHDDAAANSITAILDEGNLSLVITDNVIQVLDRGDLSHMRQGDEAPVQVSFGVKFCEFIVDTAGDPTVYDCLTHTGEAAAWVTTNDDEGDVFTLDIVFTISNPATGGKNELIVLRKVPSGQWTFNEGDEYNTLAYEGIAFMTKPEISKIIAS
jgi:hypothetical protein